MSYEVEADPSNVRIAEWMCPFCGESERVFQTRTLAAGTAVTSLKNHVRGQDDDDHDSRGEMPYEFGSEEAKERFVELVTPTTTGT